MLTICCGAKLLTLEGLKVHFLSAQRVISDQTESVWLLSDKNAKFTDKTNEEPTSDLNDLILKMTVMSVLTVRSLCFTHLAPVPKFTLTVNVSTKSVNVTLESDRKVNALWCYRSDDNCMWDDGVTPVVVSSRRGTCTCRPSVWISFFKCCVFAADWSIRVFVGSSQHPLLSALRVCAGTHVQWMTTIIRQLASLMLFWWVITESLSLACRQVFYAYRDSPRERKCPFEAQNLGSECSWFSW